MIQKIQATKEKVDKLSIIKIYDAAFELQEVNLGKKPNEYKKELIMVEIYAPSLFFEYI